MSRLAEQAGCFDDMLEFLAELLAEKKDDFSQEERDMVGAAFKSYVENDRKALEMIADIQNYQTFAKFDKVISMYKV
jgi:hypothetical protein